MLHFTEVALRSTDTECKWHWMPFFATLQEIFWHGTSPNIAFGSRRFWQLSCLNTDAISYDFIDSRDCLVILRWLHLDTINICINYTYEILWITVWIAVSSLQYDTVGISPSWLPLPGESWSESISRRFSTQNAQAETGAVPVLYCLWMWQSTCLVCSHCRSGQCTWHVCLCQRGMFTDLSSKSLLFFHVCAFCRGWPNKDYHKHDNKFERKVHTETKTPPTHETPHHTIRHNSIISIIYILYPSKAFNYQ